MTALSESKSILAKLLAQENIRVEHRKVQTAYFDLQNRVMVLPIWQDMSGDLYDLLTGHEVGHSLYTPEVGWHTALTENRALKSYLNVLEDARIERKIKQRYPGLGRSFLNAYSTLWSRDFFGVRDINLNRLLLIDRINLVTKLGHYVSLSVDFTDEEQRFLDLAGRTETWDEVEALAREIYAYDQNRMRGQPRTDRGAPEFGDEWLEEEGDFGDDIDMPSDDEAESESDSDAEYESQQDDQEDLDAEDRARGGADRPDPEPESITDRNFRERESELLDASSLDYRYLSLPRLDSRPFIMDWKEFSSLLSWSPELEAQRASLLAQFHEKNDRYIGYMVKEFEMRRNAQTQARTRLGRSGELDVKRVHNYQFSEDLFRRFSIAPNGKSHGLIMYVDMSGSMGEVMSSVIEQILVLASFCRKVNISFEIYGFTNARIYSGEREAQYMNDINSRYGKREGRMVFEDSSFRLLQLFTDSMSGMQFKRQVSELVLAMEYYRLAQTNQRYWDVFTQCTVPVLQLQSTPLRETAAISIDVFNRFRERTRADVVNMLFVTDGETNGNLCVYESNRDGSFMFQRQLAHNVNVVMTLEGTRFQSTSLGAPFRGLDQVLDLVGKATGANIMGLHLASHNIKREITNCMYTYHELRDATNYQRAEVKYTEFRRDRVAVIDNRAGWGALYVIRGSDLDIEDQDLQTQDDIKKLAREFMKRQRTKQHSRVLVNHLVGMIA